MRLGALSQDIRRKTKIRIRPRRRAGSEDILLVRNLSTSDLSNEIAEKRLRFPPGRFHGTPGLSRNGVSLPCQCEDASYYRDGSLRECRMVFPVSLEAGDGFRAQILSDVAPRPREVTVRLNGPEVSVATPRVRLELNLNTGADIRSLEFPGIHPVPLVKYLPPVYFDNIAYSNDYYSGWSQMCTRDGTIFHDTIPTRFLPDPNLFSIRVPVHFLHPFQNGFIRKTYHVYIDHPRVDLVNRFYFPEVTPYFLRTAITTFNPEAFCPEHLAYSTVQGGALPETFMLKSRVVDHTRFPGTRCSAASCLGSAGGWIAVHDRQKGLALLSDRTRCYSVPMVEYEEIRNRWLLRLYHSMAETDDTGSVTFRGHNEIRFSYLGFRGGIQNIVPAARTLSGALWVHQAGGAPEEY
jgi:hypothetical protein